MRSNALDPRSHRYRPSGCGRGSATLVWVSGRMFGCQFDAPISPAVLSPARLRSAIDIAEASPDSLLCSVAWLQFCRKIEAPAHRQRLEPGQYGRTSRCQRSFDFRLGKGLCASEGRSIGRSCQFTRSPGCAAARRSAAPHDPGYDRHDSRSNRACHRRAPERVRIIVEF